MRIKSGEDLFGVPILNVRNLLRSGGTGSMSAEFVAHRLGVSVRESRQLLASLEEQGYLKKTGDSWETTIKGNAFGGASAARPMTRKKARQLVADFLVRIEAVRDDNRYLWQVKTAVIFGSFISTAPTLGDVDIGIDLKPRYEDQKVQRSMELELRRRATDEGRSFGGYHNEVRWPETVVRRFLKNRRAISLVDLQHERTLIHAGPHAIVYDEDRVVPGAVAGW